MVVVVVVVATEFVAEDVAGFPILSLKFSPLRPPRRALFSTIQVNRRQFRGCANVFLLAAECACWLPRGIIQRRPQRRRLSEGKVSCRCHVLKEGGCTKGKVWLIDGRESSRRCRRYLLALTVLAVLIFRGTVELQGLFPWNVDVLLFLVPLVASPLTISEAPLLYIPGYLMPIIAQMAFVNMRQIIIWNQYHISIDEFINKSKVSPWPLDGTYNMNHKKQGWSHKSLLLR